MMQQAKHPPVVPRWLSLIRAFKFIANPIPILDENLQRYGDTYQFHIGGLHKGLVTVDPTVIQHVLQKNHRNYRKSNIQTGTLAHYVGNGLLTSEGLYWLRQRRLIQPGFHRDRLAGLVNLMNQEIDQYISSLQNCLRKTEEVDIYQDMHHLAFRIVARTLFSTEIDEEELTRLSGKLTELQAFIIKEIRQPFLKWWFRTSGQINKHERIAQEVKAIIRRLIDNRLKGKERHDDLLQMLLEARYEDSGTGMTPEQLLDESLILFVAGHETSANALAWMFQLLSENNDVEATLLMEVMQFNEDLSFEDLQQMPYGKHVVEESLRLYPPAWIIDRVANEDDRIGHLTIEKNMMLILYIYGAHHHSQYWHAPEVFDPSRFNIDQRKNIAPYTYFPFGGGPRLCIGSNFAMMEMQLILSRLIRKFRFYSKKRPDMAPMITLRPQGEMRFTVEMRV